MDTDKLINYPASMMLPCGCVPGFFYCIEAADLGQTLKVARLASLQGEGTQEDVARAQKAYSEHFCPHVEVNDAQA